MAATQGGRAGGALCISEKWIRKRLNLQLDSLGAYAVLCKDGESMRA